jgi:hypothetical protein
MSSGRKEALIAEISARLRRVCQHMTDEQFAAMVRDIARITHKYEGSAAPTTAESALDRAPERDA